MKNHKIKLVIWKTYRKSAEMEFCSSHYLILFLFTLLNPQLSRAVERNLSIVGLYNQSKINYELDTNSPYYTGKETSPDSSFSYGVLIETPLKSQWGFESGLIFLQKGFQLKNSQDSTETIFRWKSLYIPLTGRFHPTNNFTGSIGLYMDYCVSDIAIYTSSNSNNIRYQPMKSYGFKQFEYGMTYSAGMQFSMNSSSAFLIEIRFNESWSNLLDTNLPTVSKNEKATISETQLYLGFTI